MAILGKETLEGHPLGHNAAILENVTKDLNWFVCYVTVEAKMVLDPGNMPGRPFDTEIEGIGVRIAVPYSFVTH